MLKTHKPFRDEECTMFVGVPLGSEVETKALVLEKKHSNVTWTCYLVSSIQIVTFTLMTSRYGFAPYTSNPFLGPPIQVIDAWGSKNPNRIINHGEYWRVVTSLFLNVGLLDLVFSLFILFCLGYHLEMKWGSCRLLLVYLLSGT